LDVHRSFFVASCVCEGEVVKRCRLGPSSEAVISLISKYFPDCEVKTCYEAGYSGFWLHRELETAGVSNIVIHAASVEVAANNRVKTAKRDSLKLATQLAAGRLQGIRVPSREEGSRRLLARTREQLMRAKRRAQVQIRMRLHQFGMFPEEITGAIRLKDVEAILEHLAGELKLAIEVLYKQWLSVAGEIKELDKHLAEQAKHDPLEAIYRSVPGIGSLTARVLSTELGDMSPFRNVRALYSFTGLTPSEHSSGEKTYRGHISRPGSSRLRHLLVEASWKAMSKDEALAEFFMNLAKRTGKKRAIVAVARKLIGKVRAAVRDSKLYEVQYKEVA
jgi:transposase